MTNVCAHCMLEMHNCPSELLDDPAFVRRALHQAAQRAKATLLKEITHQFHPQGVTALALLAESHLSIHTWPEKSYAAADVFTCGEAADPEAACRHLIELFRPGRHSLVRLTRGLATPLVEVLEGDGAGQHQEAMAQCPEPTYAPISG